MSEGLLGAKIGIFTDRCIQASRSMPAATRERYRFMAEPGLSNVRLWLKAAIKLVGDLRLLWGVKRTFRVDDGILYFVDERYTDIGIIWDLLTGTLTTLRTGC